MSPAAAHLLPAIGWTLIHFAWQGAIVGCVTAIALTSLRNARPQVRYLVACAGLLACLLWPAIGLALRIAVPATADATQLYASSRGAGAASGEMLGLLGYLQSHLAWLVAAWASCAGALSVRMMLGLTWVGLAAQRCRANDLWQARLSSLGARMGIERAVRLLIVDGLASPVTAGWLRPVVLVPASLVTGMPPDLLEALLAHELGHVKRFDYLVNLGQNLVEILLFYHPAVWWISRCIRAEREQIADGLAAQALGEPRRLARALSELERVQFSAGGLAQAANGGDLMARIRRLVRPDRQALSWKAAIPVLGLAAACALVYANATTLPKSTPAGTYTRAMADFRSCEKPRWPTADLKAGHTGTVTLRYLVSADGQPTESEVLKSSGHRGLDAAARGDIAKCHFKPATQDGQPVGSWMQMRYSWVLK
jgi:D-alanyl-D-alanine endopeptidase (penicillin-binding protein 7)